MEALSIIPVFKVISLLPSSPKPIIPQTSIFTPHPSRSIKISSVVYSFQPSTSSNQNTPKANDHHHKNLTSMLNPVWNFVSGIRRWAFSSWSYCDADNLFDKNSNSNNSGYLQCGGFGTALLSVTSTATVKISPFVGTLAANPAFVSGLVAWAMAQWIKVFLNFFLERKWKFGILFESGGMPSSHSALCTALTTSVALCHGVGDSLFPLAGFSLIVMYDATGVRRHAGMQAEVLNLIVEDLFQGHPIRKRKLKEFLGHTLSQVIVGALLGIVVACYFCQGYLAAA